jgi:hypothetical protein
MARVEHIISQAFQETVHVLAERQNVPQSAADAFFGIIGIDN